MEHGGSLSAQRVTLAAAPQWPFPVQNPRSVRERGFALNTMPTIHGLNLTQQQEPVAHPCIPGGITRSPFPSVRHSFCYKANGVDRVLIIVGRGPAGGGLNQQKRPRRKAAGALF
jgi:hypothetical protein